MKQRYVPSVHRTHPHGLTCSSSTRMGGPPVISVLTLVPQTPPVASLCFLLSDSFAYLTSLSFLPGFTTAFCWMWLSERSTWNFLFVTSVLHITLPTIQPTIILQMYCIISGSLQDIYSKDFIPVLNRTGFVPSDQPWISYDPEIRYLRGTLGLWYNWGSSFHPVGTSNERNRACFVSSWRVLGQAKPHSCQGFGVSPLPVHFWKH